jgi:hypothetical protein
MLVAIDVGADDAGAARARSALGVAAEMLTAVCRDRRTSPEAVAGAADRVHEAFAEYGRQQLAAASRRSHS